jgi:predicted transcriptional regulator YheO
VSKKISFHLHVHGFDNIVQGLSEIQQTLQEGFAQMSEASDALTQAVTDVATRVNQTTDTLQVELQQIADALANTGDADLRQAANDAVQRLGAVSNQLDSMNQTIQNIIP